MSSEGKYTNIEYQNFFEKNLSDTDPEIYKAINDELARQQQHIELIASENIVSNALLEAQGSVLTNKYAEGYPGKRYYNGCDHVDVAENLANERLKKLFNCKFANSQPHSGAQANGAVFLALLKPGDTIMGMSLNSGGHLTHGSKASVSGKWFNAIAYDVDKKTELLDYESIEKLAVENKPKLIIAGGSAYSRQIDFKKFREIADKVGAYFMVDMAHFSGLVAGKGYPNPVEYADVVTSTTHKVFRSARGGIILTNNEALSKKFNSAVFPGYQGGPLMHIIAAKAVGFLEALKPEFRNYISNVMANAKILAETLKNNGFKIYSGGTDTHLMLVDLRPFNVKGNIAADSLCRANITCNKNGIPYDTESPMITSGIRLGTQAATTRGFGLDEFKKVGELITKTIKGLSANPDDNAKVEAEVREEVISLCSKFPIYKNLKEQMICPICKKGETSVVDSRPTEDGTTIRRRRLCICGERFTTFERIQFRELMVVKKNGRKSPFDRDKLSKSIYIALKKRPIDTDTVEKFITNISRALEEIGQNEISSNAIGKMVMDGLKNLDPVAYVRFASVYRNFREEKDFVQFVDKIDVFKKR